MTEKTYTFPDLAAPLLTKREQIAVQMMAALLANPQLTPMGIEWAANKACDAADILLATLKDSTIER